MHLLIAFPLLIGAGIAPASPAQPIETVSQDRAIEAELAAILADAYDADGPGAAVIVTRGGKTLFHDARGMADIATGRTMLPTERYNLASITKTITAATVAKLAEEGVLSLDDPISNYVSGFSEPASSATLRQLLNHTSGLTDITKRPGWIAENLDRDFSNEELVALLAALPAKAAPGEEWEYNNSAYMLLGPIIEQATGQPWEQSVERLVARPLGLDSFVTPGATMTGYDGPAADAVPFPPFVDKGIAGAAGTMTGTVADLATFVNALHHGRILGPDMYAQAIALPVLADGSEARYGFGFRVGQLFGEPTYYQGGAMRGTRTEALYVPEGDVFVGILANSDAPRSAVRPLAERLAAAALGKSFPRFVEQPLDAAEAMPMVGTYEVRGRRVQFLHRDDRFWFAGEGASARPVTYFGERRFFFEKERGDWFEFVRGPGGEPMLRFHDTAEREPIEARRVGGVEETRVAIDPARLAAYAGSYRTETDVTVHIELDDDGRLRMRQGEREQTAPLRALDEDRFAIDGTPMTLQFMSHAGKVTGFSMTRGARTLEAQRIER